LRRIWRKIALLPALTGVLCLSAQAQLVQEVPLTSPDLQALMNPTLQGLQLTAASSGGSVSLAMPNGQRLSLPMNLGDVRITMPDPFSDIYANVAPIRLNGAPTVAYRDGRVHMLVRMRRAGANPTIRTRWVNDHWYTPNPPDVNVNNIEINFSFAFTQNGNAVGARDLRVVATGDWDLAGILSPFSGSVRDQINAGIAQQVGTRFGPMLNNVVSMGVNQYLNSRAELRPIQLVRLTNEPSRALFVLRKPAPQLVTSNTINPGVLNAPTPSVRDATLATPTIAPGALGAVWQNASLDDWVGLWGDGTTADDSRHVVMASSDGNALYMYAGEIAADGSGTYKQQWNGLRPNGATLRPDGVLTLQMTRVGAVPIMRWNLAAQNQFAASSANLHRLNTLQPRVPRDEKAAPPEIPIPDLPIPDPKIDTSATSPNDEKLRAIEDEKRKAEAEAAAKSNPKQPQKPKTNPDAIDKTGTDNTTQVSATEGHIGDWLSNGIWKFRVTKVESIKHQFDPGRSGWGVTIEFTNVNNKKKTLSLFNTGAAGKPILADVGGEPMTIDEGDWQTGAYFKDVLPAQTRTWQIKYFYGFNEKPSAGPERLILEFDPKNGNLRDQGVKFNVADPSFRVFLK
jgi:hypothetical protein